MNKEKSSITFQSLDLTLEKSQNEFRNDSLWFCLCEMFQLLELEKADFDRSSESTKFIFDNGECIPRESFPIPDPFTWISEVSFTFRSIPLRVLEFWTIIFLIVTDWFKSLIWKSFLTYHSMTKSSEIQK